MKVELGFQPNCSEVVLHISSMSKAEVLELLKSIGIEEIEMDDFWAPMDSDPEDLLVDNDNPSLPDKKYHAIMRIRDNYKGATQYPGGCCIIGHQHGQAQMFPTMKKLEDFFQQTLPNEPISWEGDDGGSSGEFYDWVEAGEDKSGVMVDQSSFDVWFDDNPTPKQMKEVIKYAKDIFGIKSTISPEIRGGFQALKCTYDPDKVKPSVISPDKFGGIPQWRMRQIITSALKKKMAEIQKKKQ